MNKILVLLLFVTTSCYGQLQDLSKMSVKWYGAKGDGITDDTAAINKAIIAWKLAPDGAVLYFPAGKYKTTSTITIRTQRRNIVGEGFMTRIEGYSTNGPVLLLEGAGASEPLSCNNITIKNLLLFNNYSGKPSLQIGGQNVAGYYVGDGTDRWVTTCNITDVWIDGGELIMFRAADCYITGCTFEGQPASGIVTYSCGRVRILNNNFYYVGTMLTTLESGSLGLNQSIIAMGNTLTLAWRGIAILGDIYDSIISFNTGIGLGRHASLQIDQSGIYIGENTSNLNICGNIISPDISGTGAGLKYGIDIAYPTTNSLFAFNDVTSSLFLSNSLFIASGCVDLMLSRNLGTNINSDIHIGEGIGKNAEVVLKSSSPYYIRNYNSPSRFSIEDSVAERFTINTNGNVTIRENLTVGHGAGASAIVTLSSSSPFYLSAYNSPARFSIGDSMFERLTLDATGKINVQSDLIVGSTVNATNGYRSAAYIGLTVTNDIVVAGGTTNRTVYVGGILVSNIPNF